MKLLKKLSILSSTIIGAAALTAPVILSSCSSNEKDYSEIYLDCAGTFKQDNGTVKLTEAKRSFKFSGSCFGFGESVIKHDEVLSVWDDRNDNVRINFEFSYNFCSCEFEIVAWKSPIETCSFLIKNYKIQVKNLIVEKDEKKIIVPKSVFYLPPIWVYMC